MKIAQIAPLVESVPPRLYGGTERVVSWLTEELVAQGHDVTLFASGDSRTRANLSSPVRRALSLDGIHDALACNMIMLEGVAERAHEFDVLHFHIGDLHFPLFANMARKTLTTLYGRQDLSERTAIRRAFPTMPLASISHHQRKSTAAPLNCVGTVHHGLPERQFREGEGQGGYLAFLGRICPEKAPDQAIAIAERAGAKLRMAAKVDPTDRRYFEEVIRPLLAQSPHAEFIGEIGDGEKQAFLGEAKALIFPIAWPEPFGLVMIEAMACGTPVIAYRGGAVTEILEDGLTGFVVDSQDEAVKAVRKLDRLFRPSIRSRFEECFSARAMAREYAKIYRRLIQLQGVESQAVAAA